MDLKRGELAGAPEWLGLGTGNRIDLETMVALGPLEDRVPLWRRLLIVRAEARDQPLVDLPPVVADRRRSALRGTAGRRKADRDSTTPTR